MSDEETASGIVPFLDTHVHFFDLSQTDLVYDWLQADAPPDPDLGDYNAIKSQRYWPEDFVGETRFCNIRGVVHVEAASGAPDPTAESRWIETRALSPRLPAGTVAHVDLSRADATSTIEAHLTSSRIRGIRDLRSDDYLENTQWRTGYGQLANYELVFCDHPLLSDAPKTVALAQDFPDVTLCIDHAGFPRQRDDTYLAYWRGEMSKLATCHNIVLKISGLGMCDHRWDQSSLERWVLASIELFGVDRCFFGSNWPVDRLFSSYADLVDDKSIRGFSLDEQEALLFRNAERLFRLPSPTTVG